MKAESRKLGELLFLNTALIKDLERELCTSNIFEWIEQKAEDVSKFGLKKNGVIYLTKNLFHQQGIIACKPDPNSINSAYIVPFGIYYIIYYNEYFDKTHDRTTIFRRRFAIAHEIGHTLWFKQGGGANPLSSRQSWSHRDPTIEFLCSRFAAALLMPRSLIEEYLQKRRNKQDSGKVSLDVIPQIAERFNVWEQAAARRVLNELREENRATICLMKKTGRDGIEQWISSWCSIPRHIRIAGTVEGYKIPFKSSNRIVPSSLLPGLIEGKTVDCELDGRWKYYCLPQRQGRKSGQASSCMAKTGVMPSIPGQVCKIGDKVYLSFLLGTEKNAQHKF